MVFQTSCGCRSSQSDQSRPRPVKKLLEISIFNKLNFIKLKNFYLEIIFFKSFNKYLFIKKIFIDIIIEKYLWHLITTTSVRSGPKIVKLSGRRRLSTKLLDRLIDAADVASATSLAGNGIVTEEKGLILLRISASANGVGLVCEQQCALFDRTAGNEETLS
jgi:hypothetical protein